MYYEARLVFLTQFSYSNKVIAFEISAPNKLLQLFSLIVVVQYLQATLNTFLLQ